jgi:hypothetical protein
VVIACLTVVDPIVAVLLGAVLLGEGAATPPDSWVLLVGAAFTATVGVIALARHHPDAVAARAARTGAAAGTDGTADPLPAPTQSPDTQAPDGSSPDPSGRDASSPDAPSPGALPCPEESVHRR